METNTIIENWPFIANLSIGIVSIIPVIFALWFFRAIAPSHVKTLLLGIFLIVWATIMFAWLSSGAASMEASVAGNVQEQKMKEGVISTIEIWMFIFPAVTLAVGANLLTHFILTGKNT